MWLVNRRNFNNSELKATQQVKRGLRPLLAFTNIYIMCCGLVENTSNYTQFDHSESRNPLNRISKKFE